MPAERLRAAERHVRLDVKRALGRISSAWRGTASTPTQVLEACDQSDPAICRLGGARTRCSSAVPVPRPINLNPPVLDAAAAPGFRVKSARRSGSTLVLSGTIAKAATARITAKLSRGNASAAGR